MKHSRYIPALAFAGLLALGGCVAMDDIKPASGTLLKGQLDETVEAVPSRADAQYIGMYTKLGDPLSFGRFTSDRPDDFGFIMMAISNDMEAADVVTANNNYNWFSPCMELSSRNADYANPYIRYRGIYDEISRASDVCGIVQSVDGIGGGCDLIIGIFCNVLCDADFPYGCISDAVECTVVVAQCGDSAKF